MFMTKIAENVAVLTLSRAPVNAISEEWVALFDAQLDALSARNDWTVLHIRSDQRVFCAGADLREVRQRIEDPNGPDRTFAFVAGIQRLYARIERLPQVTLAEIGGAAMGGGLELALACDLRVAASNTKLGLPEAQLGLIPGAGGTQRLTRLCGRSVAARLILGAETLDGLMARDLGVVQWAFNPSELQRQTEEIVRRVAALPAAALAASKTCIAAAGEPGRGGYVDELEATRRLLTDAETRRRVSAFLSSRTGDTIRLRQQGAGR
jgi:enoyl-CoA hydratase/carnithine racemase